MSLNEGTRAVRHVIANATLTPWYLRFVRRKARSARRRHRDFLWLRHGRADRAWVVAKGPSTSEDREHRASAQPPAFDKITSFCSVRSARKFSPRTFASSAPLRLTFEARSLPHSAYNIINLSSGKVCTCFILPSLNSLYNRRISFSVFAMNGPCETISSC